MWDMKWFDPAQDRDVADIYECGNEPSRYIKV